MTTLRRMDFLAPEPPGRCRVCQVGAWTLGALFLAQLPASSLPQVLVQAQVQAHRRETKPPAGKTFSARLVSEITSTQARYLVVAPKIAVPNARALKPGDEPPTHTRTD